MSILKSTLGEVAFVVELTTLCVLEEGLYNDNCDDKDGIVDDALTYLVTNTVDVTVRCVQEVEYGHRYVLPVVTVIIESYE